MSRMILFLLLWVLPPSELLDKAGELFDGQHWHQTIEVINESLPELRQSGDEETLAECLSMLSIAYFRIGAFAPAWDAQYECYQLDLASGDAGNISSSLNTLAGICLAMENYDEGERLIKEAISYEESLGQTEGLAVRYGMASDILLKQNKVDEAIDYASRALEIDQAAGRPIKVAVRKSQLAAAYLEVGKLSEAARLIDEAARTFEAVQDLHSLTVCRHQQGMIAAKRGNFRQAANYLREGLTLSRQTGELLLQRNITRDLAVMLKDADPREAVSYMQEVLVLSDTLFHQEMTRQMAELAIQNDLALKEHTIALQEETLNMRRKQIWILIGLLVLLLALALVMMRLIFIHKRDKKLLQQASDIKDKLIVLGGGSASPKDAEEVSQLLKKLSESGSSPLSVLTAREREIALLCSKGLVNKEIADRLALSLRTVETHKNNIFRKLGINSTAELVDLLQAESK